METVASLTPVLAVAASLIAVPTGLSSRSGNLREAWTFLAAGLTFCLVASMVPSVLAGQAPTFTIADVIPGAPIQFRVDALGLLFALVSSFLWIVTEAYAIGYMRGLNEHAQTRFFTFFSLSIFSAVGVAFSANLFTMYLFYELLSFATYPLVTHKQDAESRTSGRKYLTNIVGTSIGLVLPAMIVVASLTGTLDFAHPGGLAGKVGNVWIWILLAMFVFGFAKAALMPFHSWLPAAMVAPTPVSALLHAVAVVKVGAFCILRIVTGVFGVDLLRSIGAGQLLIAAAAVTMILASCIALTQDGLKRRLAYSTVAQLAYIVFGAGLLNAWGLTGGIFHIVAHAFGKITLFFCAGAIYVTTHETKISRMAGIGRRMPLTMLAFFIASLSIIGIPPTAGFLSKWYLLNGCLSDGRWVLACLLVVSSMLNAAYFLPIAYKAFFCTDEEALHSGPVREAPLFCLIPLCLTAVISVALFFYPDIFLELAHRAIGM
ncbi:NADH/Ubiquinone/plastoquinone (complex I) [Desulfovibrio sp. X2]|uniref:monovalent cation/H+ antiporter subunit D family protein n=1 Tax=Desulfovibrio sp. X2 TaxID=941449 RepID=UPI000358BEA9|nr:monovalent cation/H+ antiporter subunit D family protein [Desulfovibrio sp. X2]EPR36329.1 NADH/Ubiquinone/plastoquinone (complex I) [Desulfovibrio sp. X2]